MLWAQDGFKSAAEAEKFIEKFYLARGIIRRANRNAKPTFIYQTNGRPERRAVPAGLCYHQS